MRQLDRSRLRLFLTERLAGRMRSTVVTISAVLSAMCAAAVEDYLLLANPASRLRRHLRLERSAAVQQEQIKAFARRERDRFVAAAACVVPAYGALFFVLSRTGLRLGEALALEWDDIDDAARQARVKWGVSEGRLEATPKDGPLTVDLSRQTVDVLRRLLVERKAEALRQGWGAVPRWVFCDDQGERLSARDVRAGFKRALRAAGLPAHFTPHGLRHTYATLLLGDGASPVYVQQQLGHSSIRLTVDLYGKWIPVPNKGVVDRLDVLAEEPGSKTVAEAAVHQLKR